MVLELLEYSEVLKKSDFWLYLYCVLLDCLLIWNELECVEVRQFNFSCTKIYL